MKGDEDLKCLQFSQERKEVQTDLYVTSYGTSQLGFSPTKTFLAGCQLHIQCYIPVDVIAWQAK